MSHVLDDVRAVSVTAARIRRALSVPVSAQSLAVMRIAVGALLMLDCWRFLEHDRVSRYWADPVVLFHFPGFHWIRPLAEPWLHLAWLAMGVAAALVMLGLFYRVAIFALTGLFGYFFLLERAEYLNHFYLTLLFLLLLCAMPAHRALSLDVWRKPALAGPVPYGAVWMMRAQMEIMLVFAGLVKLTPDWLAGEPLGMWLAAAAPTHPLGFLFGHEWVVLAAAWATIALHVLGAPLLVWQRTRLAVFVVYCAFHLANASLFNIGIFPWLTMAATTIFFAPGWPGQVMARLRGRTPPPAPVAAAGARPLSGLALAAMAVWLAVQLALPLRAGVMGFDVRWTGEGHLFSWRMRIHDRWAEGVFVVTTAAGRSWVVDPGNLLTPRQVDKMLVRPDMIHQFAQRLAAVWTEAGHREVAVRAFICKSLNGRPVQQFIDPKVDLTRVRHDPLRANDWILPLERPVWGVADNRSAEAQQDHGCADWPDPQAFVR